MGNPNISHVSPSGYDAEPIEFPVDPLARIKEDEFVVGLFRRSAEDSLEPLSTVGSDGLVDMRKEL